MAFVCENTMNTAESASSHINNNVIKDDEDDEELAQLRLAALLSRKSANKHHKQELPAASACNVTPSFHGVWKDLTWNDPQLKNDSSLPQSSFIQTQTGTSRKTWPWPSRRRGISCQKPSHRSNLIVINPVTFEGSGKVSETESYPKLVLPQHRWCASSNEDSMSPNSTNFKKKDASRFSRFESDSDSESDFDIQVPSSSGEDSDDGACGEANPEIAVQETVSTSSNMPSPTLKETVSAFDFVDTDDLCNHTHSETVETTEKANTSDSFSPYNASESSEDGTTKMCKPEHQKETFLSEDLEVQDSANIIDMQCNSQIPADSILSDLHDELDKDNILVNETCPSFTSSPVEAVSKEHDHLEEEDSKGDLASKDGDSVTENCEVNDPELTNGNDICNSELVSLQTSDVNVGDEVEQSLSKNDLRHELKKRKQKRDRRSRIDRYSEYSSSSESESDSSSKSSYSERGSHRSLSLDSLNSSDQGSSDESLSPPVKSVLSVVKPISLENPDLHNLTSKSFHETSLSQMSKGHKNQKCPQKAECHSSMEDLCNFHPQTSKRRRSSSSSVEKDYKKSTDGHFSDEVTDGWYRQKLPVHMRLGVPVKRRFTEVDETGQYSRQNKLSGKFSTNDPKKTNFRIEVSDSFDNEDSDFKQAQAKNSWRKERLLKDEPQKKRKVTW